MAHVCPDCRIPLVRKVLDGIYYDECEQCAGIWVTEIALKCFQDKGPNELDRLEEDNRPTQMTDRATQRVCPECKRPMVRFLWPGDPPVELERCDLCRGIWFDDTEISRVAQSMRPAAKQAQTQSLDADAVIAEFTAEHERTMARSRAITRMCKGMSYRMRSWYIHF